MPNRNSTDPDAQIAALSEDLVAGRTDGLRLLFAAQQASAPILIWDPQQRDLRHPVIQSFAAEMGKLRDAEGRVSLDAYDAADLSGYGGWLMLLEPILDADGAPVDYTYLHYGDEIAGTYGRDMTGRRTSEIGGYISTFFRALYRSVIDRGEWVKSLHEPPSDVFARIWRRLIVPLYDADGTVRRLVVLNVADNDLRAGLEAVPDPVMVVRQNGYVTFANRAARSLFGERQFLGEATTLEAYSGLVLDLSAPQDAVVDRRMMTEETQIGVNNDLIVHFRVTRSVIYYRDQLYYLVIAKPE